MTLSDAVSLLTFIAGLIALLLVYVLLLLIKIERAARQQIEALSDIYDDIEDIAEETETIRKTLGRNQPN